MDKKDIPRAELKLKCELMVCIPTGNGVYQSVLFKPDEATIKTVKDAVQNHSTEYFDIHSTDKVGDFTTKRLHRPIRFVEYHGSITLISLEL